MTVPYPAIPDPLVKQGGVFLNKIIGVVLHEMVLFRGNGVADVFCGLGEVLICVLADGVKIAEMDM